MDNELQLVEELRYYATRIEDISKAYWDASLGMEGEPQANFARTSGLLAAAAGCLRGEVGWDPKASGSSHLSLVEGS